ncbi:MAG: hypothetical protein LBH44_09580 [Treponema sp.]|jgi:hypothetical protein|nr:hypothetical protein [Treponema sp.]
MKKLLMFLPFLVIGLYSIQSQEIPDSVRRTVDYTIRSSVDTGSAYAHYASQHPSVFTFVNNDGSVTVCVSDDSAKMTYIYEYSADLAERKTHKFKNELDMLGAFTKDNDGSYYFFYGSKTNSKTVNNMAMVKYDKDGKSVRSFKLVANAPNSFSGIQTPFDAGTCRLELSGSMLAVYFARGMFDGHQASYGFVLDKNTFARVDKGAATHPDVGANTQMPYVSHSFNEFILPVDNGFVFVDHGDAYPRGFTFAKFQNGVNTKRLHAFKFPGQVGQNATFSEMGGLAKTSTGFIFTGTHAKDASTPRNLLVLTIRDDLGAYNPPVYITNYTTEKFHIAHPKITAMDSGKYLLMWELYGFGSGQTGYQGTHMLIIDERGNRLSDIRKIEGARLNMNDVLRYNKQNGKIYWSITDSNKSITVYALDIGKPGAAAIQQPAAAPEQPPPAASTPAPATPSTNNTPTQPSNPWPVPKPTTPAPAPDKPKNTWPF